MISNTFMTLPPTHTGPYNIKRSHLLLDAAASLVVASGSVIHVSFVRLRSELIFKFVIRWLLLALFRCYLFSKDNLQNLEKQISRNYRPIWPCYDSYSPLCIANNMIELEQWELSQRTFCGNIIQDPSSFYYPVRYWWLN